MWMDKRPVKRLKMKNQGIQFMSPYPRNGSAMPAAALLSCLRRCLRRRSCAVLLLAALLGVLSSGSARAQSSESGAGTISLTYGSLITGGGTFLTYTNSVALVGFGGTNLILNIAGHSFPTGTVYTNSLFAITNTSISLFHTGAVTVTGTLNLYNSGVSNGASLFIGRTTNAATVSILSGTNTFTGGLIISGRSVLTNSATLNTPTLTISNSGLFLMNSGVAVVNVVTNGGTFIQNGGLFDPAFFDNTGTFTLLSGTNQDTVFLNRASGTVNHSGGEHDVSVATNFGAWNISGTAVANLTNFINNGGTLAVSGGGVLNGVVTVGDTGSFSQLIITNGG
ncbi:MAG: hypothetical protein WA117_19155, partial [Verrucomicrobiia bacterium]